MKHACKSFFTVTLSSQAAVSHLQRGIGSSSNFSPPQIEIGGNIVSTGLPPSARVQGTVSLNLWSEACVPGMEIVHMPSSGRLRSILRFRRDAGQGPAREHFKLSATPAVL